MSSKNLTIYNKNVYLRKDIKKPATIAEGLVQQHICNRRGSVLRRHICGGGKSVSSNELLCWNARPSQICKTLELKWKIITRVGCRSKLAII